ncbi:MAG: HEPN domain-containing protein [Ruminococcus flavefaciens]|nr:HEPN domain-containing protein [Ruminococcus flavefaciens]
MSRLLARACVKLENAEADYRKIEMDDAYLDDCCYNLQQCIELSLKYAVEIHGGRYVENHDIRAQLNILNKLGVQIPNEALLRQNAQTFNDWEASSRYKDNFFALLEDIDIARSCANSLIRCLKEKTEEFPLEALNSFPEERLEDQKESSND